MSTIKLPKSQVQKAKEEFWGTLEISDKALRNQAYLSIVSTVSHPAAIFRGRIVSGTSSLQFLLNILIIGHYITWIVYLALVIIAIKGNIFALLIIPVVFFLDLLVVNNIQTHINVELAARLKVLDDLMESDSVFQEKVLAAMKESKI